MVALALERTGNLALIADWVDSLRDAPEPFDRNNAGHREPDNLGELLTLIALTGGDVRHPMAAEVLETLPEFRKDRHLTGQTDFAPHPVYQTKWLKYGLRRLGLEDSEWAIPAVYDSYSAVFWMDFKDRHIPGPGFDARAKRLYPYLGWAEAHFHGAFPPEDLPLPEATNGFPLTWEAEASQARYDGMKPVGDAFTAARVCAPHTWHAAEMFLCLLDLAR